MSLLGSPAEGVLFTLWAVLMSEVVVMGEVSRDWL